MERYEEIKCEVTELRNQPSRNIEANTSVLQNNNDLMTKELSKLQNLPIKVQTQEIELKNMQDAVRVRENTIEALASDLEKCIVQSEKLVVELHDERDANRKLLLQISNVKKELQDQVLSNKELMAERQVVEKQNMRIIQLEEALEAKQRDHQLFEQQLQLLREESAKQISRIKERAESQKGALQAQVGGLEKELAHSQAALKAAAKDRDDSRRYLKSEILKLESKFNEAQIEIRHLRSNIDLLKCSYSSIAEVLDDDESLHDIALHVTNADTNMTDDKKTVGQ